MSNRPQLRDEDRASFIGDPRSILVHGPATLMRLVGKNSEDKMGDPFGIFWFEERYFWDVIDILTNEQKNVQSVNHYIKLLIRDGLAVCYDWNSFGKIYRLRIPSGEELQAYVGRAKPQPLFSLSDTKKRVSLPHQLLNGGETQYVIHLNDDQKKRYVSGPLPVGIHGVGSA